MTKTTISPKQGGTYSPRCSNKKKRRTYENIFWTRRYLRSKNDGTYLSMEVDSIGCHNSQGDKKCTQPDWFDRPPSQPYVFLCKQAGINMFIGVQEPIISHASYTSSHCNNLLFETFIGRSDIEIISSWTKSEPPIIVSRTVLSTPSPSKKFQDVKNVSWHLQRLDPAGKETMKVLFDGKIH